MDKELNDLLKYSEGRELIERIATGPRKYSSLSKEDILRMKLLEEKRDNSSITENEEKELTYLIWKYTNQLN